MKKLLFIAVLLLIANSAFSADWVEVDSSKDKLMVVYANRSSIMQIGNSIKIWELVDFKVPQKDSKGRRYLSIKVLSEYNCIENKTQSLATHEYSKNMGDGNIIFSYEEQNPSNWVTVIPDSLGEVKLKYACNIEISSGTPIQADISKLEINYKPDIGAYYPSASKRAGEQGVVVVQLNINKDGSVVDAGVLQSSGFPRLDQAASEVGRRYHFEPYLVNGIPTKVITTLKIEFKLQ